VVSNKKNNEIPSTPTKKFKLNKGDTKNLLVNWNLAVDLSKQHHSNRKPINELELAFKAMSLTIRFSRGLQKTIKKIPTSGHSIIKIKIVFTKIIT
jgi:hypothetical protein